MSGGAGENEATEAAAPAASTVDCKEAASLWSQVDPKCINPGAVPQLTKLVEAAIYQPLASAGG